MAIKRSVAWTMWSVASIFYAYQYILRVAPNVMLEDIMTKYQINATVFGQYSGVYYFGYSLIHIPLGILLDRFGPKRIIPVFMLFTVLGMAPLVVSEFWVYPVLGRALVGIGSSCAILGVFKIIRMSFPEEKFTWMLSLSVTIGLLGAIYGGAPLYRLHDAFGLERVVIGLMAVGLVMSALMFVLVPKQEPAQESRSVSKEISTILGNRRVIVICLLAGLMVGPLEGFADVWGAAFLKKAYGMTDAAAAGAPSMIFLGMCFGGPILSLVARKINDIAVILAGAVIMGAAFILLLTGALHPSVIPVLFFIVGIFCAYQILAIAHVATHVPKEFVGLTSAVANMIIMIFGYFFHTAMGQAVHYFGITDNGLIYGVAIIPTALVFAAIGFLVILLRNKR